jgi:hypothetical protein
MLINIPNHSVVLHVQDPLHEPIDASSLRKVNVVICARFPGCVQMWANS